MDRQKKKNTASEARPCRTNDVIIKSIEHIDSDYEIKPLPYNQITESNWLKIVELSPKSEGLPKFIFRWDSKDEALDVDIHNVSSSIERKFKLGINGYYGHHTKRIKNDIERIFNVSIGIPDKKIFNGKVIVGLHREITL